MRLLPIALALCCLLALAVPHAAAQDFAEVFGGYSFVHASDPVTTTIACPGPSCAITTSNFHPNLNGWELAATIKPGTWFGITGDFSGHYGTVGNADTHLQTYLFGPKVALPGPISPFAHVLVGGAHETVDSGSTDSRIILPTSHSSVAVAAGVGIDIRVAPFIAFRPIQIDYLLTHFNSNTQSQPRVSAGLVLRF
jgi:hypothetical protein